MTEIIGVVEKIQTLNNNGNDKILLTLSPLSVKGYDELLFIEFQGDNRIEEVKRIKEHDMVKVNIVFRGKVSNLGRHYNNIVAKSIKSI